MPGPLVQLSCGPAHAAEDVHTPAVRLAQLAGAHLQQQGLPTPALVEYLTVSQISSSSLATISTCHSLTRVFCYGFANG